MDPFFSAPGIFLSIAGIAIGVVILSFIYDALLPIVTDWRKPIGSRIGAGATAVMIISIYCFAASLLFWM